jgi:hypothetical protein
MRKKKYTKFIHEGRYVAEVDVELIYSEEGWSPYLSLDDALKLDEIRDALKKNDIESAGKQSRLYTLKPLAV